MMSFITFIAQAIRLLPLRDGVRLSMAAIGVYQQEPGSVMKLAHLIVDHPELEPLVFELLDGTPSSTTIVEVA